MIGQYYTATRNPGPCRRLRLGKRLQLHRFCPFRLRSRLADGVLLGYGDGRGLNAADALAPAGRQFFLKVSYAFQSVRSGKDVVREFAGPGQ